MYSYCRFDKLIHCRYFVTTDQVHYSCYYSTGISKFYRFIFIINQSTTFHINHTKMNNLIPARNITINDFEQIFSF